MFDHFFHELEYIFYPVVFSYSVVCNEEYHHYERAAVK